MVPPRPRGREFRARVSVHVLRRGRVGLRVLGRFRDRRVGGEDEPATLAAFCSAVRVTLVGSTTPIAMRSPYSPIARVVAEAAFCPYACDDHRRLVAPRCARWRGSAPRWRGTMRMPASGRRFRALERRDRRERARSTTPPPGTMPFLTAARVACSASSTRSFFFISDLGRSADLDRPVTRHRPRLHDCAPCSFSLS